MNRGLVGMEMATSSGLSSIDWILVAVIGGSVILGIIFGILLGRHTMKKKDI